MVSDEVEQENLLDLVGCWMRATIALRKAGLDSNELETLTLDIMDKDIEEVPEMNEMAKDGRLALFVFSREFLQHTVSAKNTAREELGL